MPSEFNFTDHKLINYYLVIFFFLISPACMSHANLTGYPGGVL